jgi:hypothetical protein
MRRVVGEGFIETILETIHHLIPPIQHVLIIRSVSGCCFIIFHSSFSLFTLYRSHTMAVRQAQSTATTMNHHHLHNNDRRASMKRQGSNSKSSSLKHRDIRLNYSKNPPKWEPSISATTSPSSACPPVFMVPFNPSMVRWSREFGSWTIRWICW